MSRAHADCRHADSSSARRTCRRARAAAAARQAAEELQNAAQAPAEGLRVTRWRLTPSQAGDLFERLDGERADGIASGGRVEGTWLFVWDARAIDSLLDDMVDINRSAAQRGEASPAYAAGLARLQVRIAAGHPIE